jgi:hypothetical protein
LTLDVFEKKMQEGTIFPYANPAEKIYRFRPEMPVNQGFLTAD